MACKNPQLTILLCMILWIINSVEGRHTGIKIEDVKYCGNSIFHFLVYSLFNERLGSDCFLF